MNIPVATNRDVILESLSDYEQGRLTGEAWAWHETTSFRAHAALRRHAVLLRRLAGEDAAKLGWIDGALAVAESIDAEPCASLPADAGQARLTA